MNILVLGAGGREHTLAWKIKQSPLCNALYVSPGNAGTAAIAENIHLFEGDYNTTAFENIARFAVEKKIELIVVGPEAPLVAGIRDYFDSRHDLSHIAVIGPSQRGAQLEGSKDFAKAFMQRHHIPTAQSKTFTHEQLQEGLQYVQTQPLPIVLKADGLAAGKGVIICETHQQALTTLEDMLGGKKFGKASEKVVIEDFLQGIELSAFVLTDGKNYLMLPEAKDYKRIGEQDTGPNTGGMGAVTPVPFADASFMQKVKERIVEPTIRGLAQENFDYRGFIFIGLMNVQGDPYVIEYNVRLGDPETEAIIPRIESDIVPILQAVAAQKLDQYTLKISDKTATTVVMVSEGYPGRYQKSKKIEGLSDVSQAFVFHAGTKADGHHILTDGGRVLAITGMGSNMEEALAISYQGISKIHWDGLYYRKDIGKDLQSL